MNITAKNKSEQKEVREEKIQNSSPKISFSCLCYLNYFLTIQSCENGYCICCTYSAHIFAILILPLGKSID